MACPIVLNDAAFGLVGNAHERAQGFAGQAFGTARAAAEAIQAFVIDPVTLNATFRFSGDLSGLAVPSPPVISAEAFTFQPPPPLRDAPDLRLNIPAVTAAPSFTAQEPNLLFPGNPTLIGLTDPGAAPNIDFAVELATRPDFVLPPVPTLEALNLPTAPTINLPVFQGQRPDTDIPMPKDDFAWTPEPYIERILGEVITRVSAMLAGEPLPAAVAAALRARAFMAADMEETRAVDQARAEHAALGFEEPGGILNRRIAEARQGARVTRQALNRDIFIQEQLVIREDIRAAVAAGIQAEAQLVQLWTVDQQLSLDAAKFAVDVAINILNARISRLTAQVAVYEADARVYRELIQAELAKLELYRAQLEAERLRGDINRQTIELYLAQLTGVRTLVDLYVAENQGVRIELDAKLAQLQGFRDRVNLLVEQLRGQQVQWESVRIRGDIELNKARSFQALGEVYGTRVRAWSDTEQQRTNRLDLERQTNQQQLEAWLGEITELQALLGQERTRLEALSTYTNAQVNIFTGRVGAEDIRSRANERRQNLNIQAAIARADTDLKRADQSIAQMQIISGYKLEGLKTIATVSSNVGSSALSAANASASVGAGTSNNRSCNETYSFSESSQGE